MVSLRRASSTLEAPESAPAVESVPLAPPSAAFPRVNLIPDQIAEEARIHRAKLSLGAAALASVVAVGALYMLAAGEVSSAQDNLDAQNARGAALAAQAVTYAEVPTIRAQVQAAQMQQFAALGGEVRWSYILNDLALTIPTGASLTSFKSSITGVPLPAAGATAAAGSGAGVDQQLSALGRAGIGTIAYEGEARAYTDVAAFEDSVVKQRNLFDVFVDSTGLADQQSTGVADGTVAVGIPGYTFKGSATIGAKALSHRYDMKAGN
jgi:Tfp pilus assembly protein PilN